MLHPPGAGDPGGKYIDGLTSDLPRKNGWTLAEHAGDGTPDKMQRLLSHTRWEHRQAQAVVREFVIEYLADPDAVLVLDESGQEKAGGHTVGVKRQYVGCAGKITNAVNVVYASYATTGPCWLIRRRAVQRAVPGVGVG